MTSPGNTAIGEPTRTGPCVSRGRWRESHLDLGARTPVSVNAPPSADGALDRQYGLIGNAPAASATFAADREKKWPVLTPRIDYP